MAKRPKANKHQTPMETEVLAWLDNKEMDRTADYVSRGRIHQSRSTGELLERWKAAFEARAKEAHSKDLASTEQDLHFELIIRGVKPPYDQVSDSLEALTAAAGAVYEALQADPDALEEVNDDLMRDIELSKVRRNRPKN